MSTKYKNVRNKFCIIPNQSKSKHEEHHLQHLVSIDPPSGGENDFHEQIHMLPSAFSSAL